jgi:hypothetical protein
MAPEQIEDLRRREEATRRTAEAILAIAEESGCPARDLIGEVVVLIAWQNNISREDALDMVNRAHNRLTWFMQMSNWDGLLQDRDRLENKRRYEKVMAACQQFQTTMTTTP